MNFLLHRYEYPYSAWVCARGVEKKWEEDFTIYILKGLAISSYAPDFDI